MDTQKQTEILLCPPPPGSGIAYFGKHILRAAAKDDGTERGKEGPDCAEVILPENGSQTFLAVPGSGDIAGFSHTVRRGDILLASPGQLLRPGPDGFRRGSFLRLTLDLSSPRLLMQSEEGTAFLKAFLAGSETRLIRSSSSADYMTEAFRCLSSPEGAYRGCTLLTLFLLELAALPADAKPAAEAEPTADSGSLSPRIAEAVVFIRNNVLSPFLNVDTVAKHLRLSRSHTMTAFRREVGLSVHEFILRCRTEAARDLLRRYSVTETALLLNFSSSQHFSKVFREQTGCTPTEYVRTHGGSVGR